MNLVVLTPHFAPDTAPTGFVTTRIVEELASNGHTIEVVTSLPWYTKHSVEEGFGGRLLRYEDAPWGRVTRIHPFPTSDKRNLLRRALAFAGFSAVAAAVGAAERTRPLPVPGRDGADPRTRGVLAVSPPLSLGASGAAIARARRSPFVFNLQDVYPDVAIQLGLLTNRRVVDAARRFERFCYQQADAITVLSDDLRANIARRVDPPDKVHVIPNFVDTTWIVPGVKDNAYRAEHRLDGKTVVMYAGNVGLSQPLDLMIDAAVVFEHDPDVVFVINGDGAAREQLEERARGLSNVRFVGTQPPQRLPEVLAAGDIHIVPLRKGLASSSVPSKTYSILAAGRPIVASVDIGSEVARVMDRAGAGVAVPPEDPEAFAKALRRLIEAPGDAARMGASGRRFVEGWHSPAAVARAYEELFAALNERRASTR